MDAKQLLFRLIWVWLTLCLWLTFSSLLVRGASILWIVNKLLKPCICVFPIFCMFFRGFECVYGFFGCTFRRFVIFAVHSDFFCNVDCFLSFAFNLFMLLEVTLFFNVGLNLSFKEIWGICTNGKEPHMWIALWLGNHKLYSCWSCGSAD